MRVKEDNVVSLSERAESEGKSFLEQLIRRGAQQMLQRALENEVAEYLEAHKEREDGQGKQQVVGNGSLPARSLVTGVGPLEVRQPRLRHRDGGQFSSNILPPYMRRVPSLDALIPA